MRLQSVMPISGMKPDVANNRPNSSKLHFEGEKLNQILSLFAKASDTFGQNANSFYAKQKKAHGRQVAGELKEVYKEHRNEFKKAAELKNAEGKIEMVVLGEGEGAVTKNVLEASNVFAKFVQKCINIVNR